MAGFQFLVLARCALDDIPIRIFDEKQDADEYCRDLIADTHTCEEAILTHANGLGLDTSIYYHLTIVRMVPGLPSEFVASYSIYGEDEDQVA